MKKRFLLTCDEETFFKVNAVCAFLGISRSSLFINYFFSGYFEDMLNTEYFQKFYDCIKEIDASLLEKEEKEDEADKG